MQVATWNFLYFLGHGEFCSEEMFGFILLKNLLLILLQKICKFTIKYIDSTNLMCKFIKKKIQKNEIEHISFVILCLKQVLCVFYSRLLFSA
jgi:hypothetical protein